MTLSFYSEFKTRLPVVETERLSLRPVTLEHAALLTDFFNADNRDFPSRYVTYDSTAVFDEERIKNEVYPVMQEANQRNVYEMYAFRKTDNKIVGMIEFSKDAHDRTRVGYYISPCERQQGHASEAYAACINSAVAADLIREELYAHTWPGNTVSQHFLTQAGFINHGERDVTNKPGGEPYPAVVFTRAVSKDNPISFTKPKSHCSP
jgi:RimJ/RimL family protein N-acetyltransferase